MAKLILILIGFITVPGAVAQTASSAPIDVHVDLTQRIGPDTPIYRWFGYDESKSTTMKHGQQLLRRLPDPSPEPVYLRAHHLLTSGNGVAELKRSSANVFSL